MAHILIFERRAESVTRVQSDFVDIVTAETYLLGKCVCVALRALRIAHPRVIDTTTSMWLGEYLHD